MKNRRRLKNFMVQPKFQLKFSSHFILSGLVFVGIVVLFIFNKLKGLQETIGTAEVITIETQSHINRVFVELMTTSLVAFAVFSLVSFVYALVISHRIAGPQVAIIRFIEQMKNGNYDKSSFKLRKHDELKLIMDQLHELADTLQGQTNSGAAASSESNSSSKS